MTSADVRNTIIKLFGEKPILCNIEPDQDFFDVGASSLTIVDLQIQIEDVLKRSVPTAHLMGNPTLNSWVAAYTQAN